MFAINSNPLPTGASGRVEDGILGPLEGISYRAPKPREAPVSFTNRKVSFELASTPDGKLRAQSITVQ